MALTIETYQKRDNVLFLPIAAGILFGCVVFLVFAFLNPLSLKLEYEAFQQFLAVGTLASALVSAIVAAILYHRFLHSQPLLCNSCHAKVKTWKCYHCDHENTEHLFKGCTHCKIVPSAYRCKCGKVSVVKDETKPATDTRYDPTVALTPLESYKNKLEDRFAQYRTRLNQHIIEQRELVFIKRQELNQLKGMLERNEITQTEYNRLEGEIEMYE